MKPSKKLTDKAIKDGIKAGLLEEFIIDGVIKYKLSPLGKQVSSHMKSNLKDRN